MSPNPPAPGPVRSAAVVNEAIRALWARAGGTLTPWERAEYEELLAEYAAAVQADVTTAA